MLQPQHGIFVNENDRYIQIGDASDDCHMFIVKIMLKSISNLNRLQSVAAGPFHIQYTLFGNSSHTRALNQNAGISSRDNADVHTIREKIVIRFRSSLSALRLYFQKIFFVPVDLYAASDILIGSVDIQLSAMMPDTTEIRQFVEKYACDKCTHSAHGQCLIQGNAAGEPNNTFMEYEFHLQYEQEMAAGDDQQLLSGKSVVDTPLRFDEDTGHDSSIQESACSMTHLSEPPTCEAPETANYTEDDVSPTDERMPTEEPAIVDRPVMVHRTFSYRLRLQTIKFSKKPATGIWQLSLHHPKAHTPLTLTNVDVKEIGSDNVAMADVEIQLYFSAEPEHIAEVIGSEPCVLNVKGPRNVFATAELNNDALLAQVCRGSYMPRQPQ